MKDYLRFLCISKVLQRQRWHTLVNAADFKRLVSGSEKHQVAAAKWELWGMCGIDCEWLWIFV